MRDKSTPAAIAELAARQHGVVAARQLREIGLDKHAISRRRDGHLHRLHRGVYAVGHRLVSKRGRYMAAVLACGPRAVLSHRSAADLWDLRTASAGPIEVTVPRGKSQRAAIRVHGCRSLAPADLTAIEGIPVTTVARTLRDLAAELSVIELGRLIDRAERLELFDLSALDPIGRGPGSRALRAALRGWQPLVTRSELERRHVELLRAAGLPLPQLNVGVDGERGTHEVDCLWLAQRLVVQLDGFRFHRTRRDRERDATTDADLELAGLRVMRLTWGDVVEHPERTRRRLEQALKPARAG